MIPDEVKEEFRKAIEKDRTKVWAGVNQTMRKIHAGHAKIVLIAEDADPSALVTPVAQEAKIKKLPHYFGTKTEIAMAAGCPRLAAAAVLLK